MHSNAPTKLLFPAMLAALAMCGSLRAEEAKPVDIEFKQLEFKVPRGEEFDLERHVPKAARELDGKRIRLQGYMHPSVFMISGIKQFVLVADNQVMNFGPRQFMEAMLVEMAEDASATFSTKSIVVEGTLTVEPITHEGKVFAVYRLRDAKVEPRTSAVGPAR